MVISLLQLLPDSLTGAGQFSFAPLLSRVTTYLKITVFFRSQVLFYCHILTSIHSIFLLTLTTHRHWFLNNCFIQSGISYSNFLESNVPILMIINGKMHKPLVLETKIYATVHVYTGPLKTSIKNIYPLSCFCFHSTFCSTLTKNLNFL